MSKYRKISAIILLSTFSMLFLHEVVPHMHDNHEHSHSHHNLLSYTDHHHHQQNQEEREDSDFAGMFMLLLSGHTHSFHADSFDEFKVVRQENLRIIQSWSLALLHNDLNDIEVDGLPEKPSFYPPPEFYKPHIFPLDPLRGPPSLG